jgi:hypothetical protein
LNVCSLQGPSVPLISEILDNMPQERADRFTYRVQRLPDKKDGLTLNLDNIIHDSTEHLPDEVPLHHMAIIAMSVWLGWVFRGAESDISKCETYKTYGYRSWMEIVHSLSQRETQIKMFRDVNKDHDDFDEGKEEQRIQHKEDDEHEPDSITEEDEEPPAVEAHEDMKKADIDLIREPAHWRKIEGM